MFLEPHEKKLLVMSRLMCGDRVVQRPTYSGDGHQYSMVNFSHEVNESIFRWLKKHSLIAISQSRPPILYLYKDMEWILTDRKYQLFAITAAGEAWLMDHQVGGSKSVSRQYVRGRLPENSKATGCAVRWGEANPDLIDRLDLAFSGDTMADFVHAKVERDQDGESETEIMRLTSEAFLTGKCASIERDPHIDWNDPSRSVSTRVYLDTHPIAPITSSERRAIERTNRLWVVAISIGKQTMDYGFASLLSLTRWVRSL